MKRYEEFDDLATVMEHSLKRGKELQKSGSGARLLESPDHTPNFGLLRESRDNLKSQQISESMKRETQTSTHKMRPGTQSLETR